MKTTKAFYYGKFVVFGIVGLAAFTYLVMLLWNWLVPDLFNGPVVNYWQTLGLLILSKILFSGTGHKGPPRDHRHWSRHSKEEWRRKFKEKMNGIADQQKQPEGDTSS